MADFPVAQNRRARDVTAGISFAIIAIFLAASGGPTPTKSPSSVTAAADSIEATAATEPARPMPEDFFNWEKHGVADRHGWFVAPTYTDADRKRWIAENPEQYEAYLDRRRRGEYATLILFDSYCPDLRFINSIRSKIFAEWNAWTEEQRKEALDHELKMIHAQTDGWRDPESGKWVKGGGMKWFCEYTDKDIRDGHWNDVILNGTYTK
jgi:hypothetical protein